MMNISDSVGEPSCKRQENGDASTGSERPLKKARFAWQVKGNRKYHLKNESTESKPTSTTSSETDKACSSQNDKSSHNLVGSTEQNLEILGDYLLKQDFNTLDSVITDSDKPLLKPSTSLSSEELEYPRCVSSYELNSSGSSQDEHMPMQMSMVASQSYNEDQCIARWQARQMAKGFVDNTINRVLDSWMVAPLPADIENRVLALDVAEFINNLPGDNTIENEGILMAISAHGLQNAAGSNSAPNSPKEDSSKTEAFPSRTSSPIQSEEDTNYSKTEPNTDNTNDLQMSWSYDTERETSENENTFSLYPDVTSSSYLSYVDNDQLQNSSADFENECHYDFMDAAVSFAIQNKGLTPFGLDYG